MKFCFLKGFQNILLQNSIKYEEFGTVCTQGIDVPFPTCRACVSLIFLNIYSNQINTVEWYNDIIRQKKGLPRPCDILFCLSLLVCLSPPPPRSMVFLVVVVCCSMRYFWQFLSEKDCHFRNTQSSINHIFLFTFYNFCRFIVNTTFIFWIRSS